MLEIGLTGGKIVGPLIGPAVRCDDCHISVHAMSAQTNISISDLLRRLVVILPDAAVWSPYDELLVCGHVSAGILRIAAVCQRDEEEEDNDVERDEEELGRPPPKMHSFPLQFRKVHLVTASWAAAAE